MNTPKTPTPQKTKISPAKIGVIIGAIFSMLGTAAGFYFGVVRPALSNGQTHTLPPYSLLAGIILLAILITACGFYLSHPPSDQNEENW